MRKELSSDLKKISPSMTLAVTAKANELKAKGIKVYGFGAGEPDFDTPKVIRDAAVEAMEKGYTRYTLVSGLVELRKAITEKYKKDFNLDYALDEVLVSSGAKHSLSTVLKTILSVGDEVILPVPYWVSYSEMVKLTGGKPVFLKTKKENDFVVTKEQLESVITDKTKAIIINNPSNPTGVVYTKEQLEAVADVCVKHGIYIISDEIYEMLLYDDTKFTCIASLSEEVKDISIIINGCSKAYAMTGWRIGYTLANKDIIKGMNTIQGQMVSHPSSISQYAAITALTTDQSITYDMVKEYKKRREYSLKKLDTISDISYIKPQGAFYVFIDVSKLYGKVYEGKKITSSVEFCSALLESKHVAMVPGIGFGDDDFIRMSYATDMDTIKEGLDLFEEFISELK